MRGDININVNTEQRKRQRTQVNTQASPTQHSSSVKEKSSDSKVMKAAAIGLAKRAIVDVSTRYGSNTGKQNQQRKINTTMNIASAATNVGVGIVAGGVAGGAVGLAYTGYQEAVQAFDVTQQRSDEEKRREYYRSYANFVNKNNRSGGSL